MFNEVEKESRIEDGDILLDLKNTISDRVMGAFLNEEPLNRELIKSEIINSLPSIDVVLFDVRLDSFIKTLEEKFKGAEMIRGFIKEDPEQRRKMMEYIDTSVDFLIEDL